MGQRNFFLELETCFPVVVDNVRVSWPDQGAASSPYGNPSLVKGIENALVLLYLKAPAQQSDGSQHQGRVRQAHYQPERPQQRPRQGGASALPSRTASMQGYDKTQTLGTKP